jgi:pantetheine-phosphate adenylyltransferase
MAIFPGSFDPITNGHVDIVHRALTIFEQVTVGVLSNPAKKTLLSVSERVGLIQTIFKAEADRVQVRSFEGLLVEFARTVGAKIVIRGLRAISDYEYEAQMALTNRSLWDQIETVFLMTGQQHSYISSSVVKQIASFRGEVRHLVPEPVALALEGKFRT